MQNSISYHFRQGFIRMSPRTKILLLVFLVLGFLIISTIIGGLLVKPIFGVNPSEIGNMITNPDAASVGVLKFFQIIQSIFLFLVPALIAAWLYSENLPAYLEAVKKPDALTLLMVSMTLIVAIPFLNGLALFNSEMVLPHWMHSWEIKIRSLEDNAARLTELFLKGGSGFTLALNLFMIAVLPALGEEFLFRGVLQKIMIEWTKNKHWGIWIAAFAFSFVHFQFYGFLPRFLLGAYFGYLLVWSSSIWVPVTGHFINNGVAVLYYHYTTQPLGETTMDKMGTSREYNYALYLSIIFTTMLIIYTCRREKERKKLIL